MSSNARNEAPRPYERLILREGVNHDFDGNEALFERIVKELMLRGISEEEVGSLLVYGHNGAKPITPDAVRPVGLCELDTMHSLALDMKYAGNWSVLDEAWHCYDARGGRPTVTICRREAFSCDEQTYRDTPTPAYFDGSAVLLEIELESYPE